MTRLLAATALVLLLAATVFAADRRPPRPRPYEPAIHGAVVGAAKTEVDTVYVLGGPDRLDGSFEDAAGNPTWHGWTHEDLTYNDEAFWRVSDFMAPGGQFAMWCGDFFYGDPGYGNTWAQSLAFTHAVADPTAASTVHWTATLRNDTEPNYDFTYLQVNRGGEWETLEFHDGTLIVAVDQTVVLEPGDYVGLQEDEIRLRVRFESDGAWSDEDGLFDTDGACQFDDVSVTVDGVLVDFEDFEDQVSDRWQQILDPGVGDFTALWTNLDDVDPCQSNQSTQVAFIDDGVVVPGTGGSPCITWCYGPEGYIVNNTGGLMGPDYHLNNLVISPPRPWPNHYEAGIVEFSAYLHEEYGPYDQWPGIYFDWFVRATSDSVASPIEGAPWGNGESGVGYGGGPLYFRFRRDISYRLPQDTEQIQVAFRVLEYGYVWGWAGEDGTPAPYLDNVAVLAFPFGGPRLEARTENLFNDGFPESGEIDLVNLAANNVRLDAARNIADDEELNNTPGDSICVRAKVRRSGGVLRDLPKLYLRMKANPVFDEVRNLPSEFVQTGDIVSGWVYGDSTWNEYGEPEQDTYHFDLPDSGFFFPGDLLHYYIEAQDDVSGDIGTTIVPGDTAGYSDLAGTRYHPAFTVRALPSLRSTTPGDQPPMLVWLDSQSAWSWAANFNIFDYVGYDLHWQDALARLGYHPGADYDVYTTNNPAYRLGNGLGGRATATQLAGYRTLLYTAGDLEVNLLANGDYENDPSRDIQVLDEWFAQGDKNAFLTGDNLVSSLVEAGPLGLDFLATYLDATLVDSSVRELIGNQTAPVVAAVPGNGVIERVPSWIAYGGCPNFHEFDAIEAGSSAWRLAEFTDSNGNPGVYPYAAAVAHHHVDDGARVVVMPVDLTFVRTGLGWSSPSGFEGLPVRDVLLADVLTYFGESGGSAPVGVSPDAPLRVTHYPNPFNPRTTIALDLPRAGDVRLRIYDLRGALVRTLVDERLPAGRHEIVWDGTDGRGAAVASGVYFSELLFAGEVRVQKLALVR